MHSDPIADMLTQIRNAQAVGKAEISMPHSKLKQAVADVLLKGGWLVSVEKIAKAKATKKSRNSKLNDSRFDRLKIGIKYVDSKPKISVIKRVSKPGLRVYVAKDELPRVLSHYGIAVISTSRGLMTNKEAMKQGVGGEVICEVY